MKWIGGLRASIISATLMVTCSATACGGFSPAQPTALDTQPVLVLGPLLPFRTSGLVYYSFDIHLENPTFGTTVRLRQIDFTVLGPDGSAYGTFTETFNRDLRPGDGLFGAIGSFVDSNLTHRPATRYAARMSYTRADGTSVVLEGRSASPPAM